MREVRMERPTYIIEEVTDCMWFYQEVLGMDPVTAAFATIYTLLSEDTEGLQFGCS